MKRWVLAFGVVVALGVAVAQVRPNDPAGKSGATCDSEANCPLGMICEKWADGIKRCVSGCRTSRDCQEKHICARIRGCEERDDCKKLCHAPVWTGH